MSENDKKYEVFDNKKMISKLFISMAVLFLVVLIMTIIYQNDYNKMIFPFCVSIFLWIGYIWYSYNTTTRMVDLKEYIRVLKEKGKSYEEISELTEKKIDYIKKTVIVPMEKTKPTSTYNYLILGLVVTFFIAVFLVQSTNTYVSLPLVLIYSFFIGIFIIPIAIGIDLAKISQAKVSSEMSNIYKYLNENGISIDEKYISQKGIGIIIDRRTLNIAIIHIELDKPIIIPFEKIYDCELVEEKISEVASSLQGTIGNITGNKRLEQIGNYSERKIIEYYNKIGVKIIVQEEDRIVDLPILFVTSKSYISLCTNDYNLAQLIVRNIKHIINENKNDIDILKSKKDLLERISKSKTLMDNVIKKYKDGNK